MNSKNTTASSASADDTPNPTNPDPYTLEQAIQTALREGKDFIQALCQIPKTLERETHDELDGQVQDWLAKVRQHPVKAVLIAGGIGYLWSSWRTKHK